MGLLNKAMYGTRDAPAAWSRLVRKMLSALGYVPCRTSACVFFNPSTDVRVVSHVDDFLCSGPKERLVELRRRLKEGYEVDGDVLGLGKDEREKASFWDGLYVIRRRALNGKPIPNRSILLLPSSALGVARVPIHRV